MFETLQALLDAIAALSADLSAEARTTAVNELLTQVVPENFAAWRTEALAAVETIMAGEITDTELAILQTLREANEGIVAALAAAELAETERLADAERLAAEIRGSDTPPAPEGEPAPAEGEPPAAPPAEGEPAPAEGEPPAAPAEGEPPAAPAEGEAPPAEALTPEQIAASALERRQQQIRAAARRPRGVQLPSARESVTASGALPNDIEEWGIVASANAGSLVAGSPVRTREDLSEAILAAVSASRNFVGPAQNVPLFRIGGTGLPDELAALGYDQDRILGRDYQLNQDRIMRACSEQAIMARGGFDAIVASSGICAPQQVNYDLPTMGDEARPIRDQALVRFGADRGGIRLLPPVILDDVEGSVGLWDNDMDIAPGNNVKPCLSLSCPDDEEQLVAALTRCLEIGNFRSRFFGEQVEAWLRMAGVWHARFGERRLLSQMGLASTQITSSQILGTVPDTFADLDLATAGIRSSRRLGQDLPLRWVLPAWYLNQMRADQARSMPAGTADERFALTDADISRWCAARRVSMTLAMDGPAIDPDHPETVVAGQEFPRQGDGPLIGWPTQAITYLYPDGVHLFLDGGQLDFGIVRDSVLNSTNDFQMFAETFEGHAYHGDVSYELTLDTCPSGQRAALADSSAVCTAGS